MKDAMSLYAFTLFTPQVAVEVIILMALFLVFGSLQELRDNAKSLSFFCGTLMVLVLFSLRL